MDDPHGKMRNEAVRVETANPLHPSNRGISVAEMTTIKREPPRRSRVTSVADEDRNRSSSVKSGVGQERTIVHTSLQFYEMDRRERILMSISKRIAPVGLRHVLGIEKIDWSKVRKRSVYDWLFKYPQSWLAPRNAFNFLTFQWTTWGVGGAEEMKQQILTEQTNFLLVSGLMLTVVVAFIISLLTPDGTATKNFPTTDPDVNYTTIVSFPIHLSVSTLMQAVS